MHNCAGDSHVTLRDDAGRNKFAFTKNYWPEGTFPIEDLAERRPIMARSWPTLIFSLLTLVPVPAFAQKFSPMALAGFSAVPYRLKFAVVFGQDGKAVGIVQRVETDDTGRPTSVEVLEPGGAVMLVPSSLASYDSIANELIVAPPVKTALVPSG